MFSSHRSSFVIIALLLAFAKAAPSAFNDLSKNNATDFQTLSSRQSATPFQYLFPRGQPLGAGSWWTTAQGLGGARALSDGTLRPQNRLEGHPHTYENAPDGSRAIRIRYKEGSYSFNGPQAGGFSFFALGPSDVDMTTAHEITFGYSVYVDQSFDFVRGGKLPGPGK